MSDHIDCKGWGNPDGELPGGQPLVAKRDGDKWGISKDGGKNFTWGVATLDFLWWDDRETNVDVRAYWQGDDFSIYRSDGTPVNTYHELRYFASNTGQAQRWRCHWDPNTKEFVHVGPG